MSISRKFLWLCVAVLSVGAVALADSPELVVRPDSLFFRQNGPNAPVAQQLAISASGGAKLTSFTATASTSSGGNWLSVTPAAGNGPGNVAVSVNTNGLAAGEYSGTVTITAAGFSNSPLKVRVTLELQGQGQGGGGGQGNPGGGPSGPPSLIVRPSELEFKAVEGGPAPKGRQVEITSPGGANFNWTASASVSTPAGGKWLRVSPASGSGKGVLQVDVDPTNLPKGSYQGEIAVASGNSKATVHVELDLGAAKAAKLVIDPRAFNFIVNDASQKPAPKTLNVSNAGSGTLNWTARATVSSPPNGKWLSISPASGSGKGQITIRVDPTGLQPGMYAGSVVVTAGNDSAEAKVFLRVLGPSKPRVTVTPRSLSFTAVGGTVSPASRAIKIASASTGLSFTAKATTATGGNWLSVMPASGSVPATLAASVTVGSLAPGVYSATVEIKVPGAAQETYAVYVSLKVGAAGATETPHLELEPGALAFTGVKGGANPAAQKVNLQVEGASSLPWTAVASTASGGNWLSVTPTSGTATAAGPNSVSVSVSTSGLEAGAYAGTVVFTPVASSGASPVSLQVRLTVTAKPGTTGKDPGLAVSAAAAGQILALVESPADGFITRADLPLNIAVLLVDTAGMAVEGADVVVSSSNGEPDLALDELGGGLYAGLFRPLSSGPLALTGWAETDALASEVFAVTGDVESAAVTPSLVFQGGGVSAASFAPSPTPLAPGSLMALFGRGIAGPGGSARSVPLPTSLSGVSVTIGGVPAPLLVAIPAASSSGYDQINLQVPFELAGVVQADIVVNNNGVIGVPETIAIGTAPALFTASQTGDGPGAFLHADNSPVDASRPVAVGEVLQLYATGLGLLKTPVNTGDAARGANEVTGSVTATIGGVPATVRYAGAAPGWVGLYQINVVVPAGVAGDNVPVVVSVDGSPSTGRAVIPMIR
jgi:uncharacterized protein (TIGR03437 family)